MGALITQVGLEKIAEATVDKPLRIEKFAVGDGGGTDITPSEDMTGLVNEKYRDFISDKYANANNTVFESVLRANAPINEGFYIRELGLFDEDGDLIVISDTPLQYRPATEEGNIVTELLFNIAIQVENADVIEIKLNEQAFATADSVNRLLERVENIEQKNKKLVETLEQDKKYLVETLEQNKKDIVESSVGIEKWFNTDNKYKDKNIVKIGIKTYALMDSSNILKISDYPLLFKNSGAIDKGNGTFATPNFFDGTTRHLPKGNTRKLGTFENDAIKEHNHGLPNITGEFCIVDHGDRNVKGAFYKHNRWASYIKDSPNADDWMSTVSFSSHRAGVTNTYNNGIFETRMKNTAGQWYILANIDI